MRSQAQVCVSAHPTVTLKPLRGISSAGEHLPGRQGVGGSNPPCSTPCDARRSRTNPRTALAWVFARAAKARIGSHALRLCAPWATRSTMAASYASSTSQVPVAYPLLVHLGHGAAVPRSGSTVMRRDSESVDCEHAFGGGGRWLLRRDVVALGAKLAAGSPTRRRAPMIR